MTETDNDKICATNLNNPEYLHFMANRYYSGEGVNLDYNKSFKYYKKAFDIYCLNGYNTYIQKIGYILIEFFNDGFKKFNLDEILSIFHKINLPDVDVLNNIGVSYYKIAYQTSNRKEYEIAFKYLKKSYDKCKRCCNTLNLAECYRYGRGTIQNHESALKYYKEYLELALKYMAINTDDKSKKKVENNIDNVKSLINSYDINGISEHDNNISCKIELVKYMLLLPKVLGQIIGEYLYSDYVFEFTKLDLLK